METNKNLPFAAYDIAVYLPGGAVILVIALSTFRAIFPDTPLFPELYFGNDKISGVVEGVFWLALSYLTGHIASFISTYLIEKLVHNNIGYPSDVWLEVEEEYKSKGGAAPDMKPIFDEKINKRNRTWVAYAILIAQIPAIHFIFLFRKIRPFGFYTPKIPLGIIEEVKAKFDKLQSGIVVAENSRWEKIIEHHVANKCPNAYARMYNYLMIYGALRLISFIVLLVMWIIVLSWACLLYKNICNDVAIGFDMHEALKLLGLSMVYTICVMAFAKFNRRYFEESILGFLMSEATVTPLRDGPSVRLP